MATDPLASARLKLARAREHLDALDEEVRTFAYGERERHYAQHDPEMAEYLVPAWLGPVMDESLIAAGAHLILEDADALRRHRRRLLVLPPFGAPITL